MMILHAAAPIFVFFASFSLAFAISNGSADANEPKIAVIGSVEASIEQWKQADFWGAVDPAKALDVPRMFVVAVNQSWRKEANQMTVALKKEIFFRALLPLVLYANESIRIDRKRLEMISAQHRAGSSIDDGTRRWLNELARAYRVSVASQAGSVLSRSELDSIINALMQRVDRIPASLALGQAAYESAYGTSRFTLLGNALFGQWTFDGSGIAPAEQRAWKGNYKIASFDWPLESVHAYMRNLNTHQAYQPLRTLRMQLRKKSRMATGMELAGTLLNYSEKGEEYVQTLRSIIRTNGLEVADTAHLRDEDPVLVVNVDNDAEVREMQREIERLRISGELGRLIESMQIRH